MIINIKKIIRKLQYKQEFKSIKLKVAYLLEEAGQGNATNVDINFWKLYIERLEEISKNNIKGSTKFLSFTKEMYEKYFNDIEGR